MNKTEESQTAPYLSIVIPAYNEEARIASTLEAVSDFLSLQTYTSEVVISDDGSLDGTLAICREFAKAHSNFKILHKEKNHGKGAAVRSGMLEASGEYVLMCDADLATPIQELDGFWEHIKEGADIVIASRPLKESHLVRRQPFYRELAGRAFNHAVRIMAVQDIYDTQCGFKLFRGEVARRIFPLCSLDGFSFDIEVLHIAQKLGFSIVEAAVHWYHQPGSKVRVLRDGLRMLSDLVRIRLRHRSLPKSACNET